MNTLVNKFCNLLMRSGNKGLAILIFRRGFVLFLQRITLNHNKNHTISRKPTNTNTPMKNMVQYINIHIHSKHQKTYDRQDAPEGQKANKGFNTPEVLLNALVENCRPLVEIRRVRVARATYQVPAHIPKPKGQTLALRWIIESANKRKQKDKINFASALAQELEFAYKKQGLARQRRTELHKLAESHRSHMRYRWW